MKALRVMLGVGMVGAMAWWTGCATAPKEPEGQAFEVLRKAASVLAASPSFSYTLSISVDEADGEGWTVRVSRSGTVRVARPDRIVATLKDDDGERVLWFNAGQLVLLDRSDNTYAKASVPKTTDAMLDFAMNEYGLSLPLADLLFSDPYRVLVEGVETGTHLGAELLDGKDVDHLLFTQANVDWEVWVDTGETPLVRKVVITRKQELGCPQFVAEIDNWNLASSPGADAFEFKAPAGAKEITMREWMGVEE
jgi:hypothetical protein